ncbi:MAG: Ig-like domain-containing protein [Anaerolineales bacterium]
MVEMGRSSRRGRWWLWAISLVAFLASAYFIFRPRVDRVSPASGATGVRAVSPLEIHFNRPMNRASVEQRLEIEPAIAGQISWQGNTLRFEPESTWPEGQTIQVHLRAGANSALSLPMLTSRSWQFQISQPSILYLEAQNGQTQLVIQVLTEDESRVFAETPMGVVDYGLTDSLNAVITLEPQPDGSTLFLLRDFGGELLEEVHRCSIELRCRQPSLSPDAGWLAWQQQSMTRSQTGVLEPGPWQVQLLEREGNQNQIGLSAENLHSPMWITENQLAVYSEAQKALLVYELSSEGQWRQIRQFDHQLGEQWTISPDGRFVVFPEIVLLDEPERGVAFFSHLFRVELESGLRTDLSGSSQDLVEDASPAFSPNGLSLAFTRKSLAPEKWSLGRQLWLMRANGGDARVVTSEPNFNHAGIRWHPDGNRLLYVRFDQSRMDAPAQIWWYDLNTNIHQQIIEGGYEPQWMP